MASMGFTHNQGEDPQRLATYVGEIMQITVYVPMFDWPNDSAAHLAHHLRQHGVPALVGEDGQPTVLPKHGILKRGQDTVDAYCFVFEGCGPAYGGKS